MKNLQPTQSSSYRSFFRTTPLLLLLISICICCFGACNCSSSSLNPPPPDKEPEKDKQQEEAIIFLGPIHIGKSTLCNSIFGKHKFISGPSTGFFGGCSVLLQDYNHEGKLYIDTPGVPKMDVSDGKILDFFATIYEYALNRVPKNSKGFKMVICIEPKYLREEELLPALQRFISAMYAKNNSIEYGIIVNKVGKNKLKKIEEGGPEKQAIQTAINTLIKPPSEVLFLECIPEMLAAENKYFDSASVNRQKLVTFLDKLKINKVENNS